MHNILFPLFVYMIVETITHLYLQIILTLHYRK